MNNSMSKNSKAYLCGIGISVIFGLSFMFTKKALVTLTPFNLLALRFLVAFLTMSLLKLFGVIKTSIRLSDLRFVMPLCLFQPILYFTFEVLGVNLASSSEAGLMISTIPIFVIILSRLILGEKTSMMQGLFVLMSVFGVSLIVYFSSQGDVNFGIGALFLLGAVISAGFYNIYSRSLSVRYSSVDLTYVMMIVGTVFFNVVGLTINYRQVGISGFYSPLFVSESLITILYLGIASSVLAFFMMNYMLSVLPATRSSVFSNLVTLVSIFAGVVFLNENFESYKIVGSIFIILGVVGANYKKQRKVLSERE